MKKLLAGLLVILYAGILLADEGHRHLDSNQKLGVVSFSTSCSKSSQKAIEHGLALLHSFLFDDAEDQFKAAATDDSACAMCYWGEAIGLYRTHYLIHAADSPQLAQMGLEAARRYAAATYHAQLLKNCDNGTNSTRPELARVRAAVAKSGDRHFSGEVSHGQEFRQAIGRDLFFVLDPLDDGWTISVFPATQCTTEGHDDFVAVANAPFFGSNPRFIDSSNDEQSVHSSPRDFQFVLDCKSYRRESELVGTATAGNVSQKASAKAIAKLGASVMGSGKLTILDSRVVKSGKDEAGNDLQQVDWLKFQVDIVLPPGQQPSQPPLHRVRPFSVGLEHLTKTTAPAAGH